MTGKPALKEGEVAARVLGLELRPVQARGPEELDNAFATMTRARAGAVLVLDDAVFNLRRLRIAGLAAKERRPAMYGIRSFSEAGGLMSYGTSFPDNYRRAAVFVDKILKGAKPAHLPVEQPTTFELVINGKAARGLGLTIPPSLLLRADEVIQ